MQNSIFENRRLIFSLPALSAILSYLPLAFHDLSYIALFSLVPFVLFLKFVKSLKDAWLGSFLFFAILDLAIFISIAAGSEELVAFANIFIVSLIFSTVSFPIWFVRKKLPKNYFWLLVPVLLLLFEVIRGVLVSFFFPIYFIYFGNQLAQTIFLPLGRYFGASGLSAVIFSVSFAFTYFVLHRNKRGAIFMIGLMVFLILITHFANWKSSIVLNGGESVGVMAFSKLAEEGESEDILQALDDPQNSYIDNYLFEKYYSTIEKNAIEDTDVIFFPSNLVDTLRIGDKDAEAYHEYGISNNGSIIRFMRIVAKKHQVVVGFGIFTEEGGKRYNSYIYIDKDGKIRSVYHKSDLVINSEFRMYDIYPDWLKVFAKRVFGDKMRVFVDNKFDRAEAPYEIADIDGFKIGTLICSESQNPSAYKKLRNGEADLVVSPISMTWLSGKSSFYQGLYINSLLVNSRYSGLPVVVFGENNFSGIFRPNGDYEIKDLDSEKGYTIWQGDINI